MQDFKIETCSDMQCFTPKQVGLLLQVTVQTVYRWVHIGKLPPPIKICGSPRWMAKDLRRWLDNLAKENRKLDFLDDVKTPDEEILELVKGL